MIPHFRTDRRPVNTLALILALISVFVIAGCAGTSGGSGRSTVADGPAAQCRAAIADVSQHCAGEGADSRACENAKTRSRDLCIPD